MSLQREILSPVTTAGLLYPALHQQVVQNFSVINTEMHPLPCLNEHDKKSVVEGNMKKDSLGRPYDPIKRGKAISKTKKQKYAENPEKYKEIYRQIGFKGLIKQRFNTSIKSEPSGTPKSVETQELWKDEKYRKSHLNNQDYSIQIAALEKYRKEHPEAAKIAAVKGAKAARQNKSKLQLILENALRIENIDNFESDYPIYEAYCIPDIVFLKDKIAIFCDGEKWHNYPEGREKDREQTIRLIELGWKVLRFWGKEIKNNSSYCVSAIKNLFTCSGYHGCSTVLPAIQFDGIQQCNLS